MRNGTTQKARRKISPGFCIQRAKLDKLHVKGLQNCALNCAELRAALVHPAVLPGAQGVTVQYGSAAADGPLLAGGDKDAVHRKRYKFI